MRRWWAAVAAGVLIVSGCGGPEANTVRIVVAAASALFDAPLGVTVRGAPPGHRVTLSASSVDDRGRTWESSAIFAADSSGRIDPARSAPLTGSYTGAHEDGLLWSMAAPGVTGFYDSARQSALAVDLTASVDGHRKATASLTRQWRTASVGEQVTLAGREGFDGAMFSPRGATTRRPAVLAFGGSEGGTGTGIQVAEALAAKGYPALGIGYFGAPGLPATLSDIPLEYFATALRWLARQPGVDPHHVDVYGVSRGSEASLLLGADFPGLVGGVIAASPSSVVNASVEHFDRPAWTLGGKPLPYADRAEYRDPRPYGAPAAIIGVERIRGPVFLVCGLDDNEWPGCPYTQAIVDRLRTPPAAELQEPEAGHYVGVPVADLVETPGTDVGGTQQADALGRADAWPKLLAYLAAQDPR